MEDGAAPEVALSGRWDAAALGLVLLLTIGALVLSLGYPLWGDFQPGPGLFPTLAAGLAVLCALGALGSALLAERGAATGREEARVWRRLLVYAGIVLIWAASFATLGFAASGAIALTLLMRVGEGMGWLPSLAIAGVTIALGWLLFEVLLGVPLPHGVLPT
ncbi:tripartite tricarboxylate transporter TctB family protein [Falsiroseomonas sp.]|uniref:tripartite tricarboxylate transporter TctB family protein n=1 Tax=Falsiroseomonas sp. TaxID=2870721 RepID=UPI00356B135B